MKNLTEVPIRSFSKIELPYVMQIEIRVPKNKISKTQIPKKYLTLKYITLIYLKGVRMPFFGLYRWREYGSSNARCHTYVLLVFL
jgi:hypothetical protein